MRIILKPQDYNEILLYCQKKLPNEACGLLAGNIDGEIKTIEKVYCLTNLDQSPQHFSMDPQEQFTAIKEIRRMGWVLLGNFHSHPSSPARPSQEDIHLALDVNACYLILSLQDKGHPVFKSFKIIENVAIEIDILITA